MKKLSKMITKHQKLIVIVSFLLLIPALLGVMMTKINYNILVYLPKDIETIQGQNILTEDFHLGAFAFVVVDNMPGKDILSMEEKIREIDTVEVVASDADMLGVLPSEFFPEDILKHLERKDSKLMLVTFEKSTSDEATLEAIRSLREIIADHAKVGGMSAMVLDTMDLSNQEIVIYIVVAVLFCMMILLLATDSYFIPFLLLGNIGMAILYNMGTNIFLGEISYITKAISAVLQLGVTTDFSIFLYHKYENRKKAYSKTEAMELAIQETFRSVAGSSLTTIAGFLALCSMQLTLGRDIGLVMAKGVFLGLLSVLMIFPALILTFDKWIEKTKHKNIFPTWKGLQKFAIKHYILIFVCFLILLIPAWYGNKNVDVYYNLNKSLPDTLPSSVANALLAEEYHIVSPEIILLDENLKANDLQELVASLKEIPGIDMVLSPKEFTYVVPSNMLPDEVNQFIQGNGYQMIVVNSLYEIATDELNQQIEEIDQLVKKYDNHAIVAGEGPLMKDLITISDQDFKNVNYTSILVIFVLMIFTLKSISLPVLLVFVIEAAIFMNMSVSYFSGSVIPFIASIVIGTIQLGATIDYAILMSTTYLDERTRTNKKEAISKTLSSTVPSIVVSALCFFAATIGVALISRIDMIGAICKLLSRGSIISMLMVTLVLPSILLLFDKVIMKTTFLKKEGSI